MKNFPVKVDGKEYWISRSVAVVVFILKKVNNNICWLIEKRGKGAADNHGKYCTVCGYVDYDEEVEESCKREAKEECGFEMKNIDKLKLFYINSKPSEEHQNISLNYVYWADDDEDFDLKKAVGGEENEVDEVKWFKVGRYVNDKTILVNGYDILAEDWAFNHDKRLIDYLNGKYELLLNKHKNEEK